MKRTIHLTLVVILLMIAAACTSDDEDPTATPTEAPAPESITLEVSGSGSVTPILAAIADEFEAANPGYALEVFPGSGTGGGVRGIVDGSLDVAAMSRAANEEEAGQGVQYVPFGSSVTAVITHPDVGIRDLTSEQLTGIFLGQIANWSEVGGPDMPIVVYVRDPEEGNTTDIREAYIGEAEFPESAQVMPSQTDMGNVVSTVEGAIGYGTWAAMLANEADVVSVSVDGIGVDAAPESMVTDMGIGYHSDRADDVQPLVDWLASEAGQTALEAVGIITSE